MVVLTVLLLFVYGMVGWSLFGEALPRDLGHDRPGDAHAVHPAHARELPDLPRRGRAGERVCAVPFFVSYVLLAAFIVFNLLIGIVIGSMEKAREEEDERERADDAELIARLGEVQRTLARLESDLRARDRSAAGG